MISGRFCVLALSVFFLTPGVDAATQTFIQGQTVATVRANYSGYVGMQFTVGASAMTVTSLGRFYLPGNSQTHTVKLVNAKTGVDVAGATAQVTMAGGTASTYQYSSLATPIQLLAGTSYFLVSQEVSGGDSWYDYTPVTSSVDAKIVGPVFLGSGGAFILVGAPALASWSYVPANFQYTLTAVTPLPTVVITQPAANAVLSGTAAIAASATASTGFTVASLQFALNGTAIGAPVTTSPYQVTLDTTAYTDGAYSLTAVATDSGGNSGQAAAVSVTLTNGNAPVGTPFVTGATFGAIRNNYTGSLGMELTVSAQPLTVTALGRIFVTGNSGTHTVKLVNAATGVDVSGGSVQLNMTGGTSRQFKYQTLASAVTLAANSSYYLVSQETAGADQWYDYGPLTFTGVATVPGAVYAIGSSYVPIQPASYGFVPLSILYGSSAAVHAAPTVAVTAPSAGSATGTVTFSASASAATGLQIVSLQLMVDGGVFGNANTVAGVTSTISQPLATGALSNGTHSLTAVAKDSAGQSSTSAAVAIMVSNATVPPTVTVTAPSAGSVSGAVTFSASASAATGLQIVSLQLLVDAGVFGNANTVAGATSTISQSLATGSLSNGTHSLTAVAKDSAGQSTTSAAVAIVVSNATTTPTVTPLVTAQSLSGPLRSNSTGFLGMQFQIGKSALIVTQLGRFCAAGNSQTHTLKLAQSNGTDATGGSVLVSMAGCTAGKYSYGSLSSPLTLAAGAIYYLVSNETIGGDQWYDYASVTATAAATVLAPVYSPGSGYVPVSMPSGSYVPLNLQYETSTVVLPTVTLTSPIANATVSGTVTISASATAAAGLSIANVQFQENGQNVGASMSGPGPTFSTQLDTTTLPNSTYSLTVIATDSAGNSATSAVVPVTVSNAGSSLGSPFITAQTFGAVRNNFSGFVGMEFTVGGAPITLTQLGRICVAGNSGSHLVKLVNSNGTDLAGASVTVAMAGCGAGGYRYGALSAAVTLAAGTTYYLVGQEVAGGDQWYDIGSVNAAAIGSVNAPAYFASGVYKTVAIAGNSYGPFNFLYSVQATAPPLVTVTSPSVNSVLSGTVTITVVATASPGLSLSYVQIQRSGMNIGAQLTGAGPVYSLALDTKLLANGGYNLGAYAMDSTGNTTFSSTISVAVLNNTVAPTATVTTPKAGSTGTGTITVSASAVAAAGTSLASVQLLVDGQSFGAACPVAACSAVLDTTLLPDGSHVLTAIATDADEGSGVSAPITIVTANGVKGIGLLNGYMPSVTIAFGGWIGMQFTTGCVPLSVNALGRLYLPGNKGTHQLKLVLASTGADVPGGSTTLSFTGAILNRVAYAALAVPVTLPANTSYYLVSLEVSTGDQFYNYLPIETMGGATVNGAVSMQSGVWLPAVDPNIVFGPLDFKFSVPSVPFPSPVTVPGVGSPSTPTRGVTPAAYNQIIVNGQSLATGSTGSPQLTTTQPYSNVMLNSAHLGFVPLVEGLAAGKAVALNSETIDSALGNTMTRLSSGTSFVDVVENVAVGGTSYVQLAKGTEYYADALQQLTNAKTITQAAGKTYKIFGVAVMHGETDQGLGTTAAVYESDLVQWQSDFQSDGVAISGQSDSIPYFIDQTNSWTYSNVATPTVALGQLAAAEDHASAIVIVGPKYQYHYTDGVHMDNVSYRKQGEQFGKVMTEVLLSGATWKPFSPKSITRSGNVITAQFNVPVQPLQFDTSTVLPKSGMGFEYNDGSACSPFIVSAQITAGDTVTITLSATPAGTNERLRYAITGLSGSAAGRDVPGAAHGNLKDSDATVSAYGNDLSNWAVAFDKAVTAK